MEADSQYQFQLRAEKTADDADKHSTRPALLGDDIDCRAFW